jgi:hypothetical protein
MRFVAGKEGEHEEHDEHDEHDTQIEGKHTHTRYTPVVLVGLFSAIFVFQKSYTGNILRTG